MVRQNNEKNSRDCADATCSVTMGSGRSEVNLEIVFQGRDRLLRLTGGEAHAGAVAVAGPDGELVAATIVVPGHKEGPLAAECAQAAARASGRVCVAVAGIHQDDATPEEIRRIVANARTAIEKMAARMAIDTER